jgi:drug/metabolite transporter (DMT)-like permease
VSLFWGGNTVAIKFGLLDAPPLRLAGLRFLLGGVVIALWAWGTGRLAGFAIARHEWRPLGVLGLIFTAQIGLMNVGTSLTSAAHGSVVLNLYAVHTVVLAHFLIPGDRLTVKRLAGVVIAYAGIVVLFASQPGGSASLLGDAIVFVSAFLLAERLVYLARAVQKLDPVKLLLSQAAIGSVLFMAGSALTESAPTVWTGRLVTSLAYQGILIAGFNFVANLWLLQRYRPSSLVPFFLTQPLFGVVAAAIVTGEALSWQLLLACVAVAIGMGLTTR